MRSEELQDSRGERERERERETLCSYTQERSESTSKHNKDCSPSNDHDRHLPDPVDLVECLGDDFDDADGDNTSIEHVESICSVTLQTKASIIRHRHTAKQVKQHQISAVMREE